MSIDPTVRLGELGAALAERRPSVLDAAIALLESVPPALDAARTERYEIKDRIGVGGMAEVLLGAVRGAEGFQRSVAIKRVRSDLPDGGRFAANLIKEAHLASRLSHPNVASVLDFDRDAAGRLYLVMEFVDGVDLSKLIETGPLPHSVVIFIVRELLFGLGYIHELRGRDRDRGLVHRDVTPHNVLISWEGEVKLADFGIAQVIDGTMTAAAHAPIGTAGYMSPEQVNCDELDGRSDLYAAGIVLWELLALRRLGVGSARDVTAEVAFQAIPRPSQYREGVPADLEALAMRLLAFNRDERYRTAELAARDLMRCQDSPQDGRGELARLLDERFPHSRRRLPSSCPPAQGTPNTPSTRPRTATASSPPRVAPPRPWTLELWDGTSAAERARWRWLVFCVLFVLVLAAVIALLVAR